MTGVSPVIDLESERLRREALDWMRRLGSGEMTEADVAAFDRWRGQSRAHRRAFAEANMLWGVLGKVAREADARGAGASALRDLRTRKIGRRALLGGAVAAGAAYLAVRPPLDLWPPVGDLTAAHRTGTGERRKLAVAEGLSVEMNTRTTLSAPVTSPDQVALELISGQVAVQANAGRPLVLTAGIGHIRAERAEFDVRHDEGRVCVTCTGGQVEVAYRTTTAALAAGQQVTYGDAGVGPVLAANPAVVTAWKDGLLIFRDVPLAEVVAELNRYRSGRIIIVNKALADRKIVAGFRLDQIDDAVVQLNRAFGVQVRSLPGGIVLLS